VTLGWVAALILIAAHLGTRLWIGVAPTDMPAAGKIHTRPIPTASPATRIRSGFSESSRW